jgi:hypothetical protein
MILQYLNQYSIKQLLFVVLIIVGSFSVASSQEYFQQEVNYTIHVTLNDKQHELTAFEAIEYINNSPDTLSFLLFHLWPNAYSSNNTALASQLFSVNGKGRLFNDPELKGYIDSMNFKVDGQSIHWNIMPEMPDICRIILNKTLNPGDTINITTPFHVKIPKGITSRLGHIGESYQISQWYPKPAVYDKSGWHQIPYLDQGEFFSEFGKYDVSIMLPANYTVGATGDMQNEEEIERLKKLSADTSWKNKFELGGNDFPLSSDQMKVLRFTQNNVHDFAWFADKRFHVLLGKVTLPESGKEVTTMAMFTNQQSQLWKDALNYVNNSILCFSRWIGDYPYNTFTAIQSALTAGSGMEYPGITVIGPAIDSYYLEDVIAHEACHTWFYSAIGTDERRYPFMDEGITSAFEVRYMNERYPEKKLWEEYFEKIRKAKFFHMDKMSVHKIDEIEWLIQARNNLEQPANLPAPDYSPLNYNVILYNKVAKGFNYLRACLGDSVFDSSIHEYYHDWKSKHPQPEDLQGIFENHSGKDLTWFFNDFLCTTKHIDYKVISLKNDNLLLKNKGELASPLVISGMLGDSICFEKWINGFEGTKLIEFPSGNYTEIQIDPKHLMPDILPLNNNIRKSGIFRKSDPVQFQLLYTLDNPDKRTIMYIPAVNWTRENGFMVGLTIYNGFILPKPLEYFVMPFYSFSNVELAGFGRISYSISPYNCLIRMAKITLEGTQFGALDNQNYHKALIGLDLFFRNRKISNTLNQKLYGRYIKASDLFMIELPAKSDLKSYLQVGYRIEKQDVINPFSLQTSLESNKSYIKTLMEFNYRYSYYGKDNGLDIRMFVGMMFYNESSVPFYSLAPSGRSGRELYLYQGTFPDRFDQSKKTIWSHIMTLSEGGLISHLNDTLGYSRWLISLTLTSNLPDIVGQLPVKPFVNLLLNDHIIGTKNKSPLFFETGLKVGYWNFFEIYIPMLVSENIRSISGSFKERIRIVFNIDYVLKIKLKQLL